MLPCAPSMLQGMAVEDADSVARRVDELLAAINELADEVEELADDEERARLSHRLILGAYALNRRLALVRQDAVWLLRSNRNWAHSDVARLLKVPLHSAARIANTKLRRDADPDESREDV